MYFRERATHRGPLLSRPLNRLMGHVFEEQEVCPLVKDAGHPERRPPTPEDRGFDTDYGRIAAVDAKDRITYTNIQVRQASGENLDGARDGANPLLNLL